MTDTLYKLTHDSIVLTKIWKADGSIEPSAKAKYYNDCEAIEISNIEQLSILLTTLETDRTSILVRGCYVGNEQAAKNDPEYKEGKYLRRKSVFEDHPLHSIMFDFDDYKPVMDDPIEDTVECINECIEERLPECFHNVSYHYHLSSSAGSSKNRYILKVHLWFYSKNEHTSAELQAWAENTPIQCDVSVFRPHQPHFTANPIFEEGVKDPVKQRSGLVRKASDEVDLVIDEAVLEAVGNNQKPTRHQVMQAAIQNDPVALFLHENGYVKSVNQHGQLHIICPFSEGHSVESTETSTNYFPANTGGYKSGAFYCHHQSCSHRTNADFLEKIGCDVHVVLNKQDHMGTAEWLVNHRFKSCDGRTLLRFDNGWYHYNEKDYDKKDDESIRDIIWKNLNKARHKTKDGVAPYNPKQNDVSGILDALRSATRIENIEANTWLDGSGTGDCVSMSNGILDINSRSLQPHSPQFFTENSLPFEYQEGGKPTQWIGFLLDVFDGDQESIDTLQEIFGYCITPNTSLQKMFILLGATRSGKGTIARVLESMLGSSNVAGSSFSSLASNFGLQPLRGKGYDSDRFRHALQEQGNIAVIPGRKNRKVKIYYDKSRYKLRGGIERLFVKIKENRRLAVRYDKSDFTFMSFIAAAMLKIII